jgi:hypothetical protein
MIAVKNSAWGPAGGARIFVEAAAIAAARLYRRCDGAAQVAEWLERCNYYLSESTEKRHFPARF